MLIVYPGPLRCHQPAGRWPHGDSEVNACLCGTVYVSAVCVCEKLRYVVISEYVLHQRVSKVRPEMYFSRVLPVLYYKRSSADVFISHYEKTALQLSESTLRYTSPS